MGEPSSDAGQSCRTQTQQVDIIQRRGEVVSELSTMVAILSIHTEEACREQLELFHAGKKMYNVQKNKNAPKQNRNKKK